MPRPWMRRMTAAEVAEADKIAQEKTSQEIVAMARESLKKGRLIKLWFLLSCLVPVGVLAAATFPGVLPANMTLWFIALFASMCLPIPARMAADRCEREGRVIALAFWIRKGVVKIKRR